jgi:acyl dehydratase
LSLGAGADPLDPEGLRFVTEGPGMRMLPTMPVVLAYPGFWLADPATGVNARMLVHGEQGLEIHGDLPVAGELIGASRVTGLWDRGPGRGALLTTERRILEATTGRLLATLTQSIVLRGDGGFGGVAAPARRPPPEPEGPPDQVIDLPTRPDMALLYRLNGDLNPLHSDPAVAAAAGFARPILHGLATFGLVGRALLAGLAGGDPARLGGMSCRFSAPVFPGETLRVEIWPGGAFRARVLGRDVVVVSQGQATLR